VKTAVSVFVEFLFMDTVVELLPDISVETPADSSVRRGHIRLLPQTIHSISGKEIIDER
jgi:hypothetical protein